MEVRHAPDPVRTKSLTTEELRGNFLLDGLFKRDAVVLYYSHCDRAVIGSAVPAKKPLALKAGKELAANYFCERREAGVLNVGGAGSIKVDGKSWVLANLDVLYVGRGARKIEFTSKDAKNPAQFYIISYPAHAQYPTAKATAAEAEAALLGSEAESNKRSIYKMIHQNGIKSCQLVMGFTKLAEGSIWNTMPAHTHDRRSEIYMYFDVPRDGAVFHMMGEPRETRHLVVRDRQAVISPSWSIHAGAGTRAYSFCWAMGGENQEFADMDAVAMRDLR